MTDCANRKTREEICKMLNPAQRSALSTTLMQLEQTVAEMECLLDGPQQGITYATDVDWGEATIRSLRGLCLAARGHIQELVKLFDLPVHRLYGRRVVVGVMSVSWNNLEDVRPARLRRYGEVDPALGQTLEPLLELLIRVVLELRQLASRGE